MLQTLQQLGLPTTADFAGLAGRLTNIEMRLDDMDAKLDRIEKLIMRPQSVQHVERTESTKPAAQSDSLRQKTAPVATEAAKQATAAKPAAQTAPVRRPGDRVPNAAQRATAAKPKRPVAKKGAK
jgi:hypothetical protein